MSVGPVIGFPLQPLPWWARVANAAAAPWGHGAAALEPGRLMADAGRIAGLDPEFSPDVTEALAVLHDSLQREAHLHWFGAQNTGTLLRTGLAAQLRIDKLAADDPTLDMEPLHKPVIVIGLPRSGTTFLHRLLSAAPEAVGVPLHRHLFPAVHRGPDLRRIDAWIKFAPWLMASKVYGLDAIHFVRPDLPDECNFGMRLGGRSMIYWATSPAHTYLRWLLAQDLRETYRTYRRVLVLHQREHPGKRLTLKCPHHLAWLPALAENLPEAILVQTHRDPVQAVPSECKLILSLQGLAAHDLDWRRTVESNHYKVAIFARRAVAFADSDAGHRVHHVDYRQLVADPVAAAESIHRAARLPFTESHREGLAVFARNNRQHKHGKNRYTAEQFGLDVGEISKNFADYRERFLSETEC